MFKKGSRYLALILTLCMFSSSIPVVSFAADGEITVSATGETSIPEPASEPVEEPASEPASESAEEPTSEPVSEPAEEPASEPVSEPTEEPASEPTSEPTEEPASEPVSEPAEELTSEPLSEPTETLASAPIEEPTKAIDNQIIDGIVYELYEKNGQKEASIVTIDTDKHKDIIIPESISYNDSDFMVRVVGKGAFSDSSYLRIILPKGLTTIDEYAFSGCELLRTLIIPESVTFIGDDAFENLAYICEIIAGSIAVKELIEAKKFPSTPMQKITVRSNAIHTAIDGINYELYQDESSAYQATVLAQDKFISGNLVIPGSVTNDGQSYEVSEIIHHAFAECNDLTKIVIPDSVFKIGEYAFFSCKGLNEIKLPDKLGNIEDFMFTGCSSLKTVTIPESTVSVGEMAFRGCESLEFITAPSDLEWYAFGECTNLQTVTLRNGGNYIGSSAFVECKNLKKINIPTSVQGLGYGSFSGCSLLQEITLPDGITAIEYFTFKNCSTLSKIRIPKGLTTLNERAFEGCTSLKTLSLPKTVTLIEKDAFRSCNTAMEITVATNAVKSLVEAVGFPYPRTSQKVVVMGQTIPLTTFTLNKTAVTVNKGKAYTLKVSAYSPSNTTSSKTAKWSSSNTKVATVDSKGVVKGTGKGTATITCTVSGIKKTCKVTVSIPLTSFKLNKTAVSITKGKSYTLKAGSYSPSDTTSSKTAKWSSSNTKVATVTSKGVIKGVSTGTATVTCTVAGVKKTCKVTVGVPLTSFKLNRTTASIAKGKSYTLNVASYSPSNTASSKTAKWSSSNSKVATVSSKGVVKGIGKGAATITCTVSGIKKTCKVTVSVPLTSFKLNKTAVSIAKGKSYTLKAGSYSPSDTTSSKTAKWKSSNTKVATVDSKGVIKGINPGSATITCTVSGINKTCKVSVKAPMTSFTLSKTSLSVNKGKTYPLKVSAYSPSNTTSSKAAKWKSSNTKIVTVSSKGVVKGIAKGKTTITCTVSGISKTCTITVSSSSGSVTPPVSNTVYWTPNGKSYHNSRNCSTLKRSKVIHSGSVSQAKSGGHSSPCKICH